MTPLTEKELKDSPSPCPATLDELAEFIKEQETRPHDYGTCGYSISLAATATFNYLASSLGITGFQASCASLDLIKRTRDIDGPFIILQMRDCLYPQYDLQDKLAEVIKNSQTWLRIEAQKKLEGTAHPDVYNHWLKLAAYTLSPDDFKTWNYLCPENSIPEDMEERTAWMESELVKYKFWCTKNEFLRNSFTEEFITMHPEECKQFGMLRHYIDKDTSSGATSAKAGGCIRHNFEVALSFEQQVEGISMSWTVYTEKPDANGKAALDFDWEKLNRLVEEATDEGVKQIITAYIEKAKAI